MKRLKIICRQIHWGRMGVKLVGLLKFFWIFIMLISNMDIPCLWIWLQRIDWRKGIHVGDYWN